MSRADGAGSAVGGSLSPRVELDRRLLDEDDFYDELSLLDQNASILGRRLDQRPDVTRVEVNAPERVSALRWRGTPTAVVLLHGGAQNAHTWDTVALALDEPVLAVDLPGHGHSAWREDHDYGPITITPAVAAATEVLAPHAALICGMSIGALTAIALAAARPELVRRLVLVDAVPGVPRERTQRLRALGRGPRTFASFDAMVAHALQVNPRANEQNLRRGIRHNATRTEAGQWRWRYDPLRRQAGDAEEIGRRLWEFVAALRCPVLLVRGSRSEIVSDADVACFVDHQPRARIVEVHDAGHSVQSDQPAILAELLAGWRRDELVLPPGVTVLA